MLKENTNAEYAHCSLQVLAELNSLLFMYIYKCVIAVFPLTFNQSVAVGTLCDNVEVDPENGDLWLGCHPNAWKALVFDPKDPPGSEVWCFFLFVFLFSLYNSTCTHL